MDRLSKDNDYTSRFIFGAEQNEDFFTPLDIISQTNMLHEDRADNSVWLEYQNVDDGFIKTSNIKQINRAEYFKLGKQFSDSHLLLQQIGFNGCYTDDGLLDSVLKTELYYY
jgi:hypothetical protein